MKILGIALILCSGIGIALLLINKAQLVLSRVQGWLDFLRFVRSSVDNYSMSASEILRSCPEELMLRIGYPVNDCAPESFEDVVGLSDIPDGESRRLVEDFFGSFGMSHRVEQVLRCDEYIDKLRAREACLTAQLPAKKKIILSVSLCATAAVIILLL